MAIRIAKGSVYAENRNRRKINYRVQNSRGEAFSLEIEYPRLWTGSKIEAKAVKCDLESLETTSGNLLRATLPSKGKLSVDVVEERIERQQFALDGDWLKRSFIEVHAPYEPNPDIQKCISLQADVARIESAIEEQEQSAKALEEEQTRLMKLIPNGMLEQANEWRNDLASAERSLREIKRVKIPALKSELKSARDKLTKALSQLQYRWEELPGLVEEEA